jgi:hypothetical protein
MMMRIGVSRVRDEEVTKVREEELRDGSSYVSLLHLFGSFFFWHGIHVTIPPILDSFLSFSCSFLFLSLLFTAWSGRRIW